MPHRSADQQASSRGYNAHLMRGRSHPPPPSALHMIHHQDAARMAAYQHAHAAYGGHPVTSYPGHHMPPPPMWHPADAAAHLTHTEMRHPDGVVSHTQGDENPSTKRLRADTMESAEETAASALLMASGMRKPASEETEQQCSNDADVSREPLKKRKHFQVDTKIDPATGSPCHVSPGSASSREGDGQTDEVVTIVTQSSRTFLEASSGSYDARETKKEDAHFPSVLHKVLDMPDARSVLQWLPHGEAWKIVRWDALRREILPRYFPELCKGKDGSMDSFLGQVRAWGFEEITEGPDAGAYHHLSFVRGTPKLCKHMTFKEETPKSPDTKSPGSVESQAKGQKSEGTSILQVPSLTSRSDGEQEPKEVTPAERQENKAPVSSYPSGHERGPSPIHTAWQHGAMAMSYRTPDGGYADPRVVHQTSPLRHGVTFPPPYSPRFPFRTPGGPPSPLKSGRGGSRFAARNSFPVSQRGKGSGRSRILRSPITTPNSEESSLAKTNESEEPESPGLGPHLEKSQGSHSHSPGTRPVQPEDSQPTGLGPHLQKDSLTDVKKDSSRSAGISRKMTRKLPLARKAAGKESPTADASETDPSSVKEESS